MARAKSNRCRRMTREKAVSMVYTMNHFKNFELEDMPDGHEMSEESDEPAGDDDDHGQPPDGEVDDSSLQDGWGKLLREFYQSAFAREVGSFFSTLSDDGSHQCFQLLSFRPVLSLVKSFRRGPKYVCKVSVLPLQTWAVRGDQDDLSLDVFNVDDPAHMDLASFVSQAEDRSIFVGVSRFATPMAASLCADLRTWYRLPSWAMQRCQYCACWTHCRPLASKLYSDLWSTSQRTRWWLWMGGTCQPGGPTFSVCSLDKRCGTVASFPSGPTEHNHGTSCS